MDPQGPGNGSGNGPNRLRKTPTLQINSQVQREPQNPFADSSNNITNPSSASSTLAGPSPITPRALISPQQRTFSPSPVPPRQSLPQRVHRTPRRAGTVKSIRRRLFPGLSVPEYSPELGWYSRRGAGRHRLYRFLLQTDQLELRCREPACQLRVRRIHVLQPL